MSVMDGRVTGVAFKGSKLFQVVRGMCLPYKKPNMTVAKVFFNIKS